MRKGIPQSTRTTPIRAGRGSCKRIRRASSADSAMKVAGAIGNHHPFTGSLSRKSVEAANARNLFHKRVDGLIASLSFDTKDLTHFQPFIENGVPVVFFDRVEKNTNNTIVVIDNYKCGYEATQHLVEQGCRKIVHVTSSLNRNVYADRYKGYCDALAANGIPLDENLLIINDLGEQAGIAAAHRILGLHSKPDGAFITNDFVAAVCMRTLKENNVRVPEDIAIVGFNNDAISKLVEPALTTIHYPGEEMGRVAANIMVDNLKGEGSTQQISTVIIRTELIVRKSSLKKG